VFNFDLLGVLERASSSTGEVIGGAPAGGSRVAAPIRAPTILSADAN
jgi:hypothetical protein